MAVVLLAAPVGSATAHASDEVVRSVTEPDTTEPETTEPDTTEPESTAPVTTEPGPADGNGASDDTTVAIIAVVGFAALIGLAGWWMVRRNDIDDAQHPRPPTLDEPLPGQDLL
jgi:hypothetical protein